MRVERYAELHVYMRNRRFCFFDVTNGQWPFSPNGRTPQNAPVTIYSSENNMQYNHSNNWKCVIYDFMEKPTPVMPIMSV
jgi:hypothetical protein